MAERHVRVESHVGLHSRPAAEFVKAAAQAPMEVTIGRFAEVPVNAKSILGVLALDARTGEQLRLCAEGDGAEEVLDSLCAIFTEANASNASSELAGAGVAEQDLAEPNA
ncbi:HPr family phosphocarrier protein [Actinocorallia sp. A-T 12471]|uniref:HPr family phosphocarrier protein n=1 Tax=Actinocorallia sp. A-T 12471 TaxID=3089813 RepID=UPI0029CF62E3|nr:HPr family phosphocarrier protein [Actinocorallia sp. A-T 12471]MDX6744570.1 HPr family phosphocarrier protein [Actinocorallia sp. A-T 12471]